MYYTEFELKNIQKHKHLKLNLTKGLNILHGDSGKGKTAVLRGLRWLYGESEDVMNDESTKCSFSATLDNGIKVERLKSSTKNDYTIYYPNGDKKEFHKVGKTIPEEVAEVLGKIEIEVDGNKMLLDFQEQREPYFFLGEKSTTRMKLFNKLTGSELIDAGIHHYNKEIFGVNKEQTIIEKDLKSRLEEKEKIDSEFTEKQNKLHNLKKIIDEIKSLSERNKNLSVVLGKLEEINCNLQELRYLKSQKKTISKEEIDTIKSLCQKVSKLRPLIEKNKDINKTITELKSKKLSLQVIELSPIKELNNKIIKIKPLLIKNKELTETIQTLSKDYDNKKKKIITLSGIIELQNRVKSLKLATQSHKNALKGIKTLTEQKDVLKGKIQKNQARIDELIKNAKENGVCANCGWRLK